MIVENVDFSSKKRRILSNSLFEKANSKTIDTTRME
jgi:hypothetical protein